VAEDDLDRELERRFGELRAADDDQTPGLAAVLARVRPPRVPRRERRLALVLGGTAAAAAVAIFVLRPSRDHEAVAVTNDAAAIAEWTSPTGSLLDTPGDELYREAPPAAEPLPRWILDLESATPGAPAPSTPVRKGAVS
jgi:hypothetical protein